MHDAGCLAEIPVAVKVSFECVEQGTVISGIGVEQGAECLLIKIVEFALSVEQEEETVDAKVGK